MPKAYDATTKHLIEAHPLDWLAFAGFPLPSKPGAIDVVDADLSVVTTASDKLIRISDGPASYIAHVEFQSGSDIDLDGRILVYNVLARWRHRIPIRSVVLLLRPQALAKGVTGSFKEWLADDSEIAFGYRLIKVWELPVDSLLASGLGTLPLAPIAAVAEQELPVVVDRMRVRFAQEAGPEEAKELWTATEILMGLRYQPQLVETLLKGVIDMEESTTYQAIIQKGVARGLASGLANGLASGVAVGERQMLLLMGTEKFGPPDHMTALTLQAFTDPKDLERLGRLMLRASSWAEVLGT